jgi:hypothetical protein
MPLSQMSYAVSAGVREDPPLSWVQNGLPTARSLVGNRDSKFRQQILNATEAQSES